MGHTYGERGDNQRYRACYGADLDVRRDVPRYMVYKDSKVAKSHCMDIVEEWARDHGAFLIGCSFSFETALSSAGLTPRHVSERWTVPKLECYG